MKKIIFVVILVLILSVNVCATEKIDTDALSKEPSLKGIFVRKMLEKIENADEASKVIYEKALNLGLKAFSGEVKYDED